MVKSKKKTPAGIICNVLIYALIIFLLVITLVPFLYMLVLSFLKDNTSLRISIEKLLNSTWTMDNYTKVFRNGNFGRYLLNSAIASIYTVVVNCLVSAMSGYAFAKKKFVGSSKMYMLFMITIMVPGQVSLIPTYMICKSLGILNTYTVISLPCVGAFGTILMHSFIKGLPNDLLEAADIDGCGELRKFFSIVMPLIKPAMISLAIFTFIDVWGMLLWPMLTVSDTEMNTITMAIALLKSNKAATQYGYVMAGTAVAFFPPFILYLILQKQFVQGIALSGVKM